MDVALHFARPFQKAPEVSAFPPHEFPKFQETDLRHLHTGVGFDAPEQIGTSPRSQAMSLGGIPEKAELVAHAAIIPSRSSGRKIMNHEGHEVSRRRCFVGGSVVSLRV